MLVALLVFENILLVAPKCKIMGFCNAKSPTMFINKAPKKKAAISLFNNSNTYYLSFF